MKRFILLFMFLFLTSVCSGADVAITGLPNDANPTSDDLVITVNDPSGSPQTRKATIAALLVDGNIPNNITIDYSSSSGTSALTTDSTVLRDSDIGSSVQAYDADLTDLADGSLSASKVAGVADADYGDVTVSSGAWAVEDDSHAHVISNIDAFSSADLRGRLSDESGTGAAIFAGGNIGAATATTPAENDNDTSVATTAYVQTEISGLGGGSGTIDGTGSTGKVAIWSGANTITYDDDLAFSVDTLTIANTLVVDEVGSTDGTTTISNTLYVDSASTYKGVTFTGVTADPCSELGEGAIFYNTTSNYFCYCDGTNDLKMNDNTTACF